MTTNHTDGSRIRLAIAGVGNCASSLIQGLEYYREADPNDDVPGLMHVELGGYHIRDIDLVAAFDVDATKVGIDTAKAIFAQGQGAMMVAGTADFTGYRQVNPDADLSFIAWPGPEAGKKATTTGFELLYTVSAFTSPEKQEAATKFVNWLATAEAQQLVSDKIAIPVHKDVTESTDPIRGQTAVASAGGDVPVWYDLPEINGSVTATQDNHGGLWTGRLTAQQFAEAQQAAVKPSGA